MRMGGGVWEEREGVKGNPKMFQNLVLWALLNIMFTPKRFQFYNDRTISR